jgi:methyltransferase
VIDAIPPAILITIVLAAVLVMMLAELVVSRRNERVFRDLGAIEAEDDVYDVMRMAYPLAFVAMGVEGMFAATASEPRFWIGAAIFAVGKAIKTWAIVTLGHRWTYRVLVLPGGDLVQSGPYAWVRHPNYVGVIGELIGMALMAGAAVTGPLATVGFGWLLWRRIGSEERALGVASGRRL